MNRREINLAFLKSHIQEINAIMYGILIIIIPFVMLQNYLQATIYSLNEIRFDIMGEKIPLLVIIFSLTAITLIVLSLKQITFFRLICAIFIFGLLFLAENITDYYITSKYTDLQNNWHYFAYGLYASVLYRLLMVRGLPLHRVILYVYLIAASLSAFDEGYQYFLSSRVFDISDIAKDGVGINLGLLAIFLVYRKGDIFLNFKFFQKRIGDYLNAPASLLILQVIFVYNFLIFSSLLSDHKYMFGGIIIPIILFIIFFLIVHHLQKKKFRIIFITLAGALIILQTILYFTYKSDFFTYCGNNLIIYKGIAVPYFDLKVSSRGGLSVIDKKEVFNSQDIRYLINQNHNIIIIGTGLDESGGKGLFKQNGEEVHFLYNTNKNQGCQIMLLKTDDACNEFNRLAKSGYDVLMVLHNG